MELALYQPDIPQNTGAVIRTATCFGAPLHIIEPCGFPFSDKALKRTGMDYLARADIRRHNSFDDFETWRKGQEKRLILLTTKGDIQYSDFRFREGDILLLGRESAGVPEGVHKAAGARVFIPMKKGARSLNVGVAGAIVLAEGLRQLGEPKG